VDIFSCHFNVPLSSVQQHGIPVPVPVEALTNKDRNFLGYWL
jgi:hypothetical protein